MAYLHCHTKGCGWSQDDFYSKSYNPITKIIDDIKWLIYPRMIKFDAAFLKYEYPELRKYTGINVKFNENFKCFSWNWLILEIVKDVKVAMEMKWWTYNSWKSDMDE